MTAYKKYALDAFKVGAVSYILKPITEGDLDATVNRLLKNKSAIEESFEYRKKHKVFILGSFKVYGKIVMILDNSRIHHAKLIQPFLQDTPRLKLVFLPPYSPQLNLIEGLWKWLKSDIINNAFYSTAKEINAAVKKFIKVVNSSKQKVIDRLCIKL